MYNTFGQDLVDDAAEYGADIAKQINDSRKDKREIVADDFTNPEVIYSLIKENDETLRISCDDTVYNQKRIVCEVSKDDEGWLIKGLLATEAGTRPRLFKTTRPAALIQVARHNFGESFVETLKECLQQLEKKNLNEAKSKNPGWGFQGTLESTYGLSGSEAEKLFSYAVKQLQKHYKTSVDTAVEFLDSRRGRHFADELSFHGAEEGGDFRSIMKSVDTALKKAKWLKKEILKLVKD